MRILMPISLPTVLLSLSAVLSGCKHTPNAGSSVSSSTSAAVSVKSLSRNLLTKTYKDVDTNKVLYTANEQVRFLADNGSIWSTYERLIAAARHEVVIASFHVNAKNTFEKIYGSEAVRNDPFEAVASGLIKAQAKLASNQKLAVRILINLQYPFDEMPDKEGLGDSLLAELLPPQFQPDGPGTYFRFTKALQQKGVDLSKVSIDFATFKTDYFDNLHDKYLVVDGKDTVVGSGNLHIESSDHPDAHRQTAVWVRGKAALGVLDSFDRKWTAARTQLWLCDVSRPAFDPEYCKNPRGGKVIQRDWLNPNFEGSTPVLVLPSPARAYGVKETATALKTPLNDAMLAAIAAAKVSIKVESPNISSHDLMKALQAKAKEGVAVYMVSDFNKDTGAYNLLDTLFSHGGSNDSVFKEIVPEFNRSLPSGGKPIEVRWYADKGGARVPDGDKQGMNHSKTLIVDDSLAIVGSANQEFFSWYFSSELNIAYDDPSAVADTAQRFDKIWSVSKRVQ